MSFIFQKLKEEDLESFVDFDFDEGHSSKRETFQRCSFLAASLLPMSTSRMDLEGSLKPSLKKSKQCDSLFCKSSFSLNRDTASRRTLRTTFSLPAVNLEFLKQASTITESSIIMVDSSTLNFANISNFNNNDNVVSNVDLDNSNKNEGTNDNNNIKYKNSDSKLKNGKGKKRIVVRQYEVICDEEEELVDLNRTADVDIDDDRLVCNNCNCSDTCNDYDLTEDDITACNDNINSSSDKNYNINSSFDKLETIFMKECLKMQPIHVKLDHASPVQLRNFGTHFVPDFNMAERMHFEHILITMERWVSLQGWADSVRCVKLPNFLRKSVVNGRCYYLPNATLTYY